MKALAIVLVVQTGLVGILGENNLTSRYVPLGGVDGGINQDAVSGLFVGAIHLKNEPAMVRLSPAFVVNASDYCWNCEVFPAGLTPLRQILSIHSSAQSMRPTSTGEYRNARTRWHSIVPVVASSPLSFQGVVSSAHVKCDPGLYIFCGRSPIIFYNKLNHYCCHAIYEPQHVKRVDRGGGNNSALLIPHFLQLAVGGGGTGLKSSRLLLHFSELAAERPNLSSGIIGLPFCLSGESGNVANGFLKVARIAGDQVCGVGNSNGCNGGNCGGNRPQGRDPFRGIQYGPGAFSAALVAIAFLCGLLAEIVFLAQFDNRLRVPALVGLVIMMGGLTVIRPCFFCQCLDRAFDLRKGGTGIPDSKYWAHIWGCPAPLGTAIVCLISEVGDFA